MKYIVNQFIASSCTEKQLKEVPNGTFSALSVCESSACKSATPNVLALSSILGSANQSRPIFLPQGSDNSIKRL